MNTAEQAKRRAWQWIAEHVTQARGHGGALTRMRMVALDAYIAGYADGFETSEAGMDAAALRRYTRTLEIQVENLKAQIAQGRRL